MYLRIIAFPAHERLTILYYFYHYNRFLYNRTYSTLKLNIVTRALVFIFDSGLSNNLEF